MTGEGRGTKEGQKNNSFIKKEEKESKKSGSETSSQSGLFPLKFPDFNLSKKNTCARSERVYALIICQTKARVKLLFPSMISEPKYL